MFSTVCCEPFFTWLGYGGYIDTLLFRHKAQHREDGETSQKTGTAVQEAQQEGVSARAKQNILK